MIYKLKRSITLLYATHSTIIESTPSRLNGVLRALVFTAPSLTSNATSTIEIIDSDGHTIFSKSGIVHNATTVLTVDTNNQYFQHPLHGDMTFKITTSQAQDANKEFGVKLYYEK